MATEVDARLEKIGNTNFYTAEQEEPPDDSETTQRIDLTAFDNGRRPDESLNELIRKS